MATQGILLVLAKVPAPGKVKTRLCPPATQQQAAEIAAAALLDTLEAAQQVEGARMVVSLAGDIAAGHAPNGNTGPGNTAPGNAATAEELRVALEGARVVPQRGESFADRLATAHADVAELFPGLPVFQIGMDTPQLRPDDLAAGLEAVGRPYRSGAGGPVPDGVLGPALDGGWWGLGLRDPRAAAALRRVPTSRADTGARTMQELRCDGLRIEQLPARRDVDTMQDAWTVAADCTGSRFAEAVRRCPPPEPSPEVAAPEVAAPEPHTPAQHARDRRSL